jgi:hypothetical protein
VGIADGFMRLDRSGEKLCGAFEPAGVSMKAGPDFKDVDSRRRIGRW